MMGLTAESNALLSQRSRCRMQPGMSVNASAFDRDQVERCYTCRWLF